MVMIKSTHAKLAESTLYILPCANIVCVGPERLLEIFITLTNSHTLHNGYPTLFLLHWIKSTLHTFIYMHPFLYICFWFYFLFFYQLALHSTTFTTIDTVSNGFYYGKGSR